jgi:hypothetical protein
MIDLQALNIALMIILIVAGYIINPIMCICFAIEEDESVFMWLIISLWCPIAGYIWLGERRRRRRRRRQYS